MAVAVAMMAHERKTVNLGLDFGTSYAKVAAMSAGGGPRLLQAPRETGDALVPTAVTYAGDHCRIGWAARDDGLKRPDDLRCEAFNALLPLGTPEEWAANGWRCAKSPSVVCRDFLDRLLPASLDGLVVAVPEQWRGRGRPGTAALGRILVEDLGLPLRALVSEPVCVAAHLVDRYLRQQPRPEPLARLLVCDAGGGTFDVTLCAVAGTVVQVVDTDRSDAAGRAFDRAAVQLAYAQAHGHSLDASGPELARLLPVFERAKRRGQRRAAAVLEKARTDPRYREAMALRFGDRYELSAEQVEGCLLPVAAGIREATGRLLARHGALDAATAVAVVGGFSLWPTVRAAVLEALGRGDSQPEAEVPLDEDGRAGAVAYGAALIAEGAIDPRAYYPHTVSLRVRQIRDGRLVTDRVTLAAAGTVELDSHAAAVVEPDRAPLVVEADGDAGRPLAVDVQPHGRGEHQTVVLGPAPLSRGAYHVGLQVDGSSLATVVLRPTAGGEPLVYPIGDPDARDLEERR